MNQNGWIENGWKNLEFYEGRFGQTPSVSVAPDQRRDAILHRDRHSSHFYSVCLRENAKGNGFIANPKNLLKFNVEDTRSGLKNKKQKQKMASLERCAIYPTLVKNKMDKD